jgi:uncharacterized protein (TIGR02246 family)
MTTTFPARTTAASGTAGDPTSLVAELFEHLEKAWNRADGAAFGAVFADEADFVDIRGTHHRGSRDVIGHGHQMLFDSIYAGSTVHYQPDVARPVAPGAVIAIATSTLDAPSGPLQGRNHSRISATIVETGDGWKITAFHNTLLRDGD